MDEILDFDMKIQSHSEFSKLAEFDPVSGTFKEYPRQNTSSLSEPLLGSYATLDGVLLIFYRQEHFLWLRIDEHVVKLDENTTARRVLLNDRARLEILRNDYKLTEVTYSVGPYEGLDPRDPVDDLTPFSSNEDFDFGLFVFNVLTDDRRRAAIYAP